MNLAGAVRMGELMLFKIPKWTPKRKRQKRSSFPHGY